MGVKNRARYSVDDWRKACPTVRSMRRAAWEVLAVCPVCDLQMVVDLAVTEAMKGPDFRLWGQSTKCRRRWCRGQAEFFVQPPGADTEVRMTAG